MASTAWDVDVLVRGEWHRLHSPVQVEAAGRFETPERAFQAAFAELDRLPWIRLAVDVETYNPTKRGEVLRAHLVEGLRVTERDT